MQKRTKKLVHDSDSESANHSEGEVKSTNQGDDEATLANKTPDNESNSDSNSSSSKLTKKRKRQRAKVASESEDSSDDDIPLTSGKRRSKLRPEMLSSTTSQVDSYT